MPISRERCRRCRYDDKPLIEEEIADLQPFVPGWDLVADVKGDRLYKSFTFEDWSTTMEFAGLVSDHAVLEDHHPTMTIAWVA